MVRLPLFTAFFLITGGWVLINPSVPTGIVFVYTLIDFTNAAKQEEKLLLKQGLGYAKYISKTPRFFPR